MPLVRPGRRFTACPANLTWVFIIDHKRLPGWTKLGSMDRNGDFLVQQPSFCGGAATQAQREHPNRPTKSPLQHDHGVADANRVVGFSYDHSVDRDRLGGTEASGKGAGFGQTGEPQPLIEAAAWGRK
jgi:hypothetical protein